MTAIQSDSKPVPHLQTPAADNKEKIGVLIHKHPTIVKVAEASTLILGGGLLASLPFTVPVLSTGLIVGTAITGTALTLASIAATFALDIFVPPHHDMKTHVFKLGECEGGKLYYEGDVPILTLNSDDPYKAGMAHGYLCGDAISRVTKRFDLVLHTLARQPRANQLLPQLLDGIRHKIPKRYLDEMQGLIDGYNKWAKENKWQFPKKITLDDLLLFHLMPDSMHFHPKLFNVVKEKQETQENPNIIENPAVACTAVVDRNPTDGFVFVRNMDWPSFGLAGTYSLIINRKYTNQLYNTVEVGVPGLVGTLTGMNDQGLSIAMNVCTGLTKSVRGMPASFYNRACLDNCKDVAEVEKFVDNNSPLGPYHLTAVDSNRAESIHFYQSPNDTHVIRPWSNGHPLSTLNYRYSPAANYDMHDSSERQEAIDYFFQQNRPIEEVLELPYVNNWITTNRVIMKPQAKSFEVAFDNAFAGNAPLNHVSTENLLHKNG